MRQASAERRGGAQVAERLKERRSEIEQATMTRVYAVSEPPPLSGPEYTEGLRAAVAAGIDYGLEGIERGEQSAPPVPDVLLSQARLAARSGVSLDTVLRRYFAGHTLIEDFMVQEAEGEKLSPPELKRLLRSQAAIVDRLLAAVSEAYTEEAARRFQGAGRRRVERIERLLAGEPLDTSGLGYELEGWHLGLLFAGAGAKESLRDLAARLECRSLCVRHEEGVTWAWLGTARRLDPDQIRRAAEERLPAGLSLAIGEPGEGPSGWRLTHRQARAALPIASEGRARAVRYGEVALQASIRQDEVLCDSLQALYLAPLARAPDGGACLRETLRAYFATGRNVSSAAALLEVDRRTVTNRLRVAEECIGRPLNECALNLQMALCMT